MGDIVRINHSFGGLPEKYKYNGWLQVPRGEYLATLETWVTFKFMTSPRIALIFNIIDTGENFGKHIPAFFGVKRHRGKTREKGEFIAAPRGDLMAFFYTLNPESPKVPHFRIPLSKLNKVYSIKVGDVTNNRNQKKHPNQLIYSRVIDAKPA